MPDRSTDSHDDTLADVLAAELDSDADTIRRDALIIRVERARAPPERVRSEARSDGRYERIEEEWTGCRWRPVGRELVADVTVEGRPAALG